MDTVSRIQDIPVGKRLKKRSTGIVGLNLLLDGGFSEGTLIMLYGNPISGIDLAAQQFWKVEGEEGTYLVNDGDIEAGMIDATEMHPEIYQTQITGTRIVVDSLSTLIVKYGIDEALKFLKLAREEVKNRGANMMFIVYTGIHTQMEMTRIMKAADIVIEFRSETHQAEIERTLAVQKIKNAAAPLRLLPFIITERGIEASTTSRVV